MVRGLAHCCFLKQTSEGITCVVTPVPQLKYGRLAPHPESTHPRLKLARFLRPGFALTVPGAVDYLSRVYSWPVYANDSLSDCTAAAAGHLRQAWTCYGQGATTVTADSDVLAFYEACSGYQPGNPSTDNGAVMQDCLGYWRQTGLATDKILAYFQVNPADLAEVKTAAWLFGGLYVGVNLPISALDQFNAGQPWDLNPSADNRIDGGHCVHLGAIDSAGVMTVTTWGKTQRVTPAWWRQYTEEAWAVATLDWVRNYQTPENLDTTALNAEFQQLTGEPGPFPAAPAPTTTPPSPAPQPGGGPSVADLALAHAVHPRWLTTRHLLPGNHTVAAALTAWFTATGLTPTGK